VVSQIALDAYFRQLNTSRNQHSQMSLKSYSTSGEAERFPRLHC